MNIKLLIIFITLNILNVILSTVKSICTLKGNKFVAATANAISYAVYTVVIIYMVCDLTLWVKVVVVAICNFIGVYIVKWIEEKSRRVKFWKVEMTILSEFDEEIKKQLCENKIIFTEVKNVRKYTLYNCLCRTKDQTRFVHKLVDKYKAHYFIAESKDF